MPPNPLREDILNLWAADISTDAIAAKLGISRNAVVGLVNRARRKGDPRAKPRDPCIVRKATGGMPRARKAMPVQAVAMAAQGLPMVAVEQTAVVTPLPKRPLLPPDDPGCRWPLPDPVTGNLRHCAAPRFANACPYCRDHAARAYVRNAA